MRRRRTTKVDKERRILTVQGWIIDGVQDNLIIRQARQQWEISKRQAERYLKEAYDNWKPDQDRSIDTKRAAAVARLQKIARDIDPYHKKTPSGANSLLAIERQIHRLENMIPPRQVHVEVKEVHEMTQDERQRRLEELLKKLGK